MTVIVVTFSTYPYTSHMTLCVSGENNISPPSSSTRSSTIVPWYIDYLCPELLANYQLIHQMNLILLIFDTKLKAY